MSDKLKLEVLFSAIDKITAPLKSIRGESKNASKEVLALRKTLRDLERTQASLKNSSVAGNQMMASYQQHLSKSIDETNSKLYQQSTALEKINQKMKQLNAARAKYDSTMQTRDKVLNAGASLSVAGAAVGAPILYAIKQYASFEDAMLGVARQVDGVRDANGKLTPTYYEMADSIKAMSERLPMTANEIASIVEAGARMGIQGKKDLLGYAETTAKMADAFNLPVDQIGEQTAKVAQLYKIPISNIKTLGDTINWLDDNALSKGGDIIDVLQRIAGTAETVNMKYKEAAALGSTFLSSGSTAEIAATASNAVMRELAIATMQPEKFQAGLAMIKMSGEAIQNSMSKDATGTILKVLDALKKLPKQKQLEATTRLFGKEYGDDVAKLSANVSEYRRQLALVNATQANGSMDRESKARLQNLSAQYELVSNKVTNLSSAIGSQFKPALIQVLGAVGNTLTSIKNWTQAHPVLTGYIVKGVAAFALLLTILGALAIALAAIIGPFAIFRYGIALLPIIMSGVATGFLKLLIPIKWVGQAVLWLSRLFLANPIIAAITAIAVAAYLIYKYWDPIKKFFGGLWASIKQYFFSSVYWIASLSGLFTDAGKNLMIGFGNGIMIGLGWVKDKITGAASSVVGWFKEKLGIRSPSRVFAQLGNYTMLGLEQGLGTGEHGVLKQIITTSKRMAALAGGVAITGTALAGNVQFDTRPPLGAGGMAGGTVTNVFQINIHGADIEKGKTIAQQVAEEIQRIQAKERTAKRARLRDSE